MTRSDWSRVRVLLEDANVRPELGIVGEWIEKDFVATTGLLERHGSFRWTLTEKGRRALTAMCDHHFWDMIDSKLGDEEILLAAEHFGRAVENKERAGTKSEHTEAWRRAMMTEEDWKHLYHLLQSAESSAVGIAAIGSWPGNEVARQHDLLYRDDSTSGPYDERWALSEKGWHVLAAMGEKHFWNMIGSKLSDEDILLVAEHFGRAVENEERTRTKSDATMGGEKEEGAEGADSGACMAQPATANGDRTDEIPSEGEKASQAGGTGESTLPVVDDLRLIHPGDSPVGRQIKFWVGVRDMVFALDVARRRKDDSVPVVPFTEEQARLLETLTLARRENGQLCLTHVGRKFAQGARVGWWWNKLIMDLAKGLLRRPMTFVALVADQPNVPAAANPVSDAEPEGKTTGKVDVELTEEGLGRFVKEAGANFDRWMKAAERMKEAVDDFGKKLRSAAPAVEGAGEYSPPLDKGIERYVRVLAEAGVETYESCEGGAGHSYPEPTVRFHGGAGAAFHALATAIDHGLPAAHLRQAWDMIDGAPTGPHWELAFWRKDEA